MKSEREVVILHEISICVTLKDGARGMDLKYAVYKTGKNFIRIPYNHPNAQKYSFGAGYQNLSSRVPVNELMLVQQPSWHDDTTDCVRRQVWCLEKDQKKALEMVRDAVHRQVIEMKKEMDTLHGIWLTQAKIARADNG